MKEIWNELMEVGWYENKGNSVTYVYARVCAWYDYGTKTLRIDMTYTKRIDGNTSTQSYGTDNYHNYFAVVEEGTTAIRHVIAYVDAHITQVRSKGWLNV